MLEDLRLVRCQCGGFYDGHKFGCPAGFYGLDVCLCKEMPVSCKECEDTGTEFVETVPIEQHDLDIMCGFAEF
jgi:hypothetical protein